MTQSYLYDHVTLHLPTEAISEEHVPEVLFYVDVLSVMSEFGCRLYEL